MDIAFRLGSGFLAWFCVWQTFAYIFWLRLSFLTKIWSDIVPNIICAQSKVFLIIIFSLYLFLHLKSNRKYPVFPQIMVHFFRDWFNINCYVFLIYPENFKLIGYREGTFRKKTSSISRPIVKYAMTVTQSTKGNC